MQGWERGRMLEQPPKNHLYNKCKEGAWRLDVDIEEVRNVGADESDGDDEAVESEEDEAGEDVVVDEGESDRDSLSGSGSDDWTSESEEESDEDEESDDDGEEWIAG